MMAIEEKSNKYMFSKIEGELYGYYRDLKRKEIVKEEIDTLNNMLEEIDNNIRTCNITIDADISGMGISEKVQTSSTGESAVEKAIDRSISTLEREQAQRIERLYKAETELRNIEYKTKKIKSTINLLNEDYKYFINLKYNLCLRDEEIADRLHVSIKSAYNKRIKVIKEIIRFKMI